MATDMKKALRQSALLRNRLETCLRCAPAPMTGRELYEWPSVLEVVGTSLSGYSKLSTQLKNMLSKGVVEKIGMGAATTYRWQGASLPAKPTPLPELKLRVNKTNNTLTLQFAGLAITIEVAG